MADLEELGEALLVTEERKQELSLSHKRMAVEHSLVLHRDSTSASDVKAMIAHLEREGMPDSATLRVDGGSERHTRMWAKWSTEAVEEVPF